MAGPRPIVAASRRCHGRRGSLVGSTPRRSDAAPLDLLAHELRRLGRRAARRSASAASGQDLARAVLFIAYWGVVGIDRRVHGCAGLFGLAFSVIGLRLLVLYFEAIGGLTATGLGLIGGGVLCLGLAAIGWRLMRRMSRRPAGAAHEPRLLAAAVAAALALPFLALAALIGEQERCCSGRRW